MNKTLTQEQRINIVRYRIESAENTLAEVVIHRANGFYNTAKLFIQTIKEWINHWLIEQENEAQQ